MLLQLAFVLTAIIIGARLGGIGLGVLAGALYSMKAGKEQSEDPEFQKRVANKEYEKPHYGTKAVKGPVFSAGMQAVVAIFGIAWMGDTFIGGNIAEIKGSVEAVVTEMPWLFGVAVTLGLVLVSFVG